MCQTLLKSLVQITAMHLIAATNNYIGGPNCQCNNLLKTTHDVSKLRLTFWMQWTLSDLNVNLTIQICRRSELESSLWDLTLSFVALATCDETCTWHSYRRSLLFGVFKKFILNWFLPIFCYCISQYRNIFFYRVKKWENTLILSVKFENEPPNRCRILF